jgi:hypothetical protein
MIERMDSTLAFAGILATTLCGMLNTAGGIIFIGMTSSLMP